MVKDHGRAEDITQEVFISALRRMRETDRPIAFKPWVYEIAKNACIDQFRRSRRTEEVSFDAGEGLAGADHGRLVASDPTPDAAVDAKQQLDHLCGAFGGLSDSHHEILVLRELEGLSYREIGDRMGLSRPGVESTLFRARKRLTEEYDELVSGQRCVRIQTIIAAAAGTALGRARHAPPRPPRRPLPAVPPPGRRRRRRRRRHGAQPPGRRVVEQVAGLLPLPGLPPRARLRGASRSCPVSEPMAAAWSKAVAVAATVIVAGVGAGVAPQRGDSAPRFPTCARRPSRPRWSRAPARLPRRPACARWARRRHARPPASAAPAAASGRPPQRRAGRAAAERAAHAHSGRQRHAGARPPPTRKAAANPGTSAPKPSQAPCPAPLPAGAPGTPSLPKITCRRSSGPCRQPGRRPGRRDGRADPRRSTGRRPGRGHGQRRDWRSRPRRLGPLGGRARERLASRPCLRSDAFVESLMDTNLYSIGAYFHDRHPELVESVVDEAEAIERDGLEAYARRPLELEAAFQTLVTGLAVRYYRAVNG